MFYNSTFNKANLNLLIYRDLPEALKLQKMCKLNSLAVITAQTVEIKPFALQSSSKWISGLIAKRVHCKNTVGHQFTKDISDAPVLEFCHCCASPLQPQPSLILNLPGFFFTTEFWTRAEFLIQ